MNNINYNYYKCFENINLSDIFDIKNIDKLNDFLKNGLPYKFISKEEFIKNENNLSKIREKYLIEKEMPFYNSSYKVYKQINNDFYNENQDLKYNPTNITYKIEYLLKKNTFYSGEFSNTNLNPEGIGIKRFNKGDIYIGNFENGKFNGYGKYKEHSGTVFQGYTLDIMRYGIGHYSGSLFPGEGGTIILAGHNDRGFLYHLPEIKVGDKITINAVYGTFTYEVESTKVIDAKDNDAFPFYKDKEVLMIYTCYPVNTIGHKTHRFLVYAKKVGESYEK